VDALKEALYRGEWWAPRRTAALRSAAAAALARIGTTPAVEALKEAVHRAPRRIRAAARAHLRAGPHITPEAIR
jgi:HEAT repeat protein